MSWSSLGEAFVHVVSSPFQDLSVLWTLVPLFLMWLLLEVYFIHWDEDLGWNSALANSVTLFWVSATGLQVLFADGFSWAKFIVLFLMVVYAGSILVIVFKHAVREQFAYIIASPIFIYYLSIILTLWVHDALIFSWWVLLVIILIYLFFLTIDLSLKKWMKKEKTHM